MHTDYAPDVVANARAAAKRDKRDRVTVSDLRRALVLCFGAAVLHMRARLPYKDILAKLEGE
jgi:hypothetical protein